MSEIETRFWEAIRNDSINEVSLTRFKKSLMEERQAKIDALMLEYCPDEMTEEQLRVCGESQRSSSR